MIITSIVLVIFVGVSLYNVSLVYNNMYEGAKDRSFNAINNIIHSIEVSKTEIEEEVDNVAHNITNSIEDIQKFLNFFVVENSWVATAKFAYLDGKGEDCAYIAYRDSTGKVLDSKFTNKDDYASWDWYKSAIENNESSWSDPFYNHTQKIIVANYSYPIKDSETDEIIAIWSVDVEFIDIKTYLEDFLPYSNSQGYILYSDGTFLDHPNDRFEFSKYDEIDEKYKNGFENTIYELMLSKKTGYEIVNNNRTKYFVFYCFVSSIRSSLAIVCPFDDVFKDVFNVRSVLWKIILIAVLFLALSILAVIQYMLRPLKDFAKAVRTIADGKYDAPLPKIKSRDELRDFHDALNYMQYSLVNNIEELKQSTAQKARIENELLLAKQIQTNLLSYDFTPYLDYPQLDLYAKLKSAREVGGDFYDFFVRDSKLFFTIADVAGKGVPASLFMSMTYKVFRVVANKEYSPAIIAQRINTALADHNKDNMFVTMFIGVLDLFSGELSYINAGHNPPLLISTQNSFIEVEQSVPIGVFPNTKYSEFKIRLEEGSALLLYTDGIVEAENKTNDLYGEDRLQMFIKDKFISSCDIVNNVYSSVVDFTDGNPQNDDLTLLCLKYAPLSISFNKLEDIEALPAFIERLFQGSEATEAIAMLNLALEELIVNAIQYSNSRKVSLGVNKLEDSLKFTLIDSGVVFDPTLTPDVDISLSPEDRQIGGLGIHIAKQVLERIEYKRIDNLNVLYAYYKYSS